MLSLVGLLFGLTLVSNILLVEKKELMKKINIFKLVGIFFGIFFAQEVRNAKEYIRKFAGNKRTPY